MIKYELYEIFRWKKEERSLRGVVVIVLDSDIVVKKFELQSRFYIHFQINTLGKVLSQLGIK